METHLHILHADDDHEDRWLFREGLSEVDKNVSLTQFKDGKELLSFLFDASQPHPIVNIIICDMQMPLIGGVDLLEIIKQTSSWKHIPVIIFSTSSSVDDIKNCTQKGAAAFFSKPSTYAEILIIIRNIISNCRKGMTALLPIIF